MSVGYVAFFTRHLRYSRTKIVPVWVLYSNSTPKLSNQNTVFHTNEHFTLMSTSTVYFLSQTSIISVIFRFIFWSVYNVTSFNFIVIVLTFRSKKNNNITITILFSCVSIAMDPQHMIWNHSVTLWIHLWKEQEAIHVWRQWPKYNFVTNHYKKYNS
jgi:hypothetical protein